MKRWIPLIIPVVLVALAVWWSTDGFDLSRTPPRPGDSGDPGDPGARPEDLPPEPGTGTDEPGASDPTVEPERGEILVFVRTDNGQPAAGATVTLVPGGVVKTDAEGIARLRAPGGRGRIRVRYSGSVPLDVEASLEPGTVTLDLPAGLEVEGRLIVNDGEPPEPVELRLYSSGPLGSEPSVPEFSCRAYEGGRFRFFGLPDGWAGRLVVPNGYEILSPKPEGRTIPVSAPTRGLEIRVHRQSVLFGRVFRAGGEEHAPDAQVRLKYKTDGGGGSMLAKADAEGRFRAQLPWRLVKTAFAIVSDREDISRVRIDINPALLTSDYDLGSIELPGFREVTLLVRDKAGKPLVDARVEPVNETTGADGSVRIRVAPDVDRLRVGKPGYRVAEVDLSAGQADPIEVTLAPGNLLEIRVVGTDGKPPPRVVVLLRSPSPLFDTRDGGNESFLLGTGVGRRGSASWGEGLPAYFYFGPDKEGRVLLSGIRPGVAFTVQAVDHTLDTVLAEETVSVEETGRRTVTLPISAEERVFAGQVVDEEGKPIRNARVRVGRAVAWTDAAGRFRVGGVRVPAVPIVVEKGGRAPFAKDDFPVSEESRITLPAGRRVIVRVLDPAGKPVTSAEVRVESGGRSDLWEADPQDDGGFALDDLPAGVVRITAIVAGRLFDLRHDTAHDKAVIRVPAFGSAVVRWRFKLDAPIIHRIRLEPTGSEGHEVTSHVDYFPDLRDWEIRVPAVLPGSYRVHLEAYDDEAERDDVYRPVLAGPKIRVKAGETVEAELTR